MTISIELDTAFTQDTHGMYTRLRTEAPVHPVLFEGGVRGWLVTRYADALLLLNDPRLINDPRRMQIAPYSAQPYRASVFNSLLMLDPPEHTRLRRLVVKAFTPRIVERMQPRTEALATELLDAIDRSDTRAPVDLIASYAEPLPIRVISDLLGMPADLGARFRAAIGPLISIATNDAKAASERETIAVLEEVVEYKRRMPGEDLLTSLVAASADGHRLSHDELIATCFLLISAGYETTVHLIANGVLALLNNPSQLEAVRRNPELIANAVEEVLRFDGPANVTTARYTAAEITIDDVVIPRDEVVLIGLHSANRDGERFDNADHFDVTRTTRGHLAFGYGIHHCLGAALARMEGVTALRLLLNRYKDIELDRAEPLRYQANIVIHGLAKLPVLLSKGRNGIR